MITCLPTPYFVQLKNKEAYQSASEAEFNFDEKIFKVSIHEYPNKDNVLMVLIEDSEKRNIEVRHEDTVRVASCAQEAPSALVANAA